MGFQGSRRDDNSRRLNCDFHFFSALSTYGLYLAIVLLAKMGSITNGERKAYPPGIHVPCLTWFANGANQEVEWDLQRKHLEFLISSGLDGSKCTTFRRRSNHLTAISRHRRHKWRSRYFDI